MGERINEDFLSLFCEKNSDGTKHLRLKGKELAMRIGSRLNHMDMYYVSLYVNKNPDIVSIDLCYNNIGDIGIEIMVENYLSKPNNLLHLNVMSCDITSLGLSLLYKVYQNLKLVSLRLTGNKLGERGGEYVAKFLECIPTIELLELGGTDQVLSSIDSILEKAKNSNLKVLDISRIIPKNSSEILDSQWVATNVGILLEVNSNLTELHLEKCELDGHDTEKLIYGLSRNKTLKLLDISANRIGCFGLEIISKWLMSKPPLLALDVSSNSIGNYGARALSFGMCYSKIKFLNISYNKIGDDGMACILDTLKKPYVMKIFFFYGNPFGKKTIKIVERMILSQVLNQEQIDIKLYKVDGVLYYAYYPTNHFKQNYYSVMMHGSPVELKIKKNRVEPTSTVCRPFYHLPHYERYPSME